eukprot:5534727-Pleurochrysis_carterae.AAC.3
MRARTHAHTCARIRMRPSERIRARARSVNGHVRPGESRAHRLWTCSPHECVRKACALIKYQTSFLQTLTRASLVLGACRLSM